jgi:hypothetical protein
MDIFFPYSQGVKIDLLSWATSRLAWEAAGAADLRGLGPLMDHIEAELRKVGGRKGDESA